MSEENQKPSSSEPGLNLSDFWAELKQRKVVQVAFTYVVVSWVILQVASTVFEGFGISNWAFQIVFFVLTAGFPVTLVLAWPRTSSASTPCLRWASTLPHLHQLRLSASISYSWPSVSAGFEGKAGDLTQSDLPSKGINATSLWARGAPGQRLPR